VLIRGQALSAASRSTAFSSKLILVVIVVQSFFFDDVEFNGIEADNFQLHPTFITIDKLAFIRLDVDVDIAFTFGTRSGRHADTSRVEYTLPSI
jgi:hypothetical protein